MLPEDVNQFADDVKDSILLTMMIFDFELVADGELPASEIIWTSKDGEEIADSILKINPDKVEALKQKLREYYLANPSRVH